MTTTISATTRARLLAAAINLFAERGFHGTTVRDVVRRAGVNQVAVNYHFGSEDELYREVFGNSLRRVVSRRPAAVDGAAPDALLSAFVRELFDPLLQDERETHKRLMAWEQPRPTGLLPAIPEREMLPHLEFARGVVAPFLPPGLALREQTAVTLWLVGQCVMFHHASDLLFMLHPGGFDRPLVDALARRVADLALGGLAER